VFETLSALACAFLLCAGAPKLPAVTGIVLLVAGVVWALRARPKPLAAKVHVG